MIRPVGIGGRVTPGAVGADSPPFVWTESGEGVVPHVKIVLYGEDSDSEGPTYTCTLPCDLWIWLP